VRIHESDIATHLYHIAQEAVNNALKHGHPRHVVIRLAAGERSALSVDDDGVGVQESRHGASGTQGMGLLIMSYRAKMIGGSLEVRPGPDGGTSVCCSLPPGNLEREAEL
jgi:signal transduction histidine kinase